MILNEGFQVDEYLKPRALFEREKYKIMTASRWGGPVKPGRKYQEQLPSVMTDLAFDRIEIQNYDAIAFTGGGGAWTDYFPNPTLHRILLKAV
jgi:putative intracellular protease/amidase